MKKMDQFEFDRLCLSYTIMGLICVFYGTGKVIRKVIFKK